LEFGTLSNVLKNLQDQCTTLEQTKSTVQSQIDSLKEQKSDLIEYITNTKESNIQTIHEIQNSSQKSISDVTESSTDSIKSITNTSKNEISDAGKQTKLELSKSVESFDAMLSEVSKASEVLGKFTAIKPLYDIINGVDIPPINAYFGILGFLELFFAWQKNRGITAPTISGNTLSLINGIKKEINSLEK
jgi:DNA anti-recombination protein RmuC